MQTIEYRTVDKAGWPAGPWQDEPDKVQWQDEVTKLPCVAKRNASGVWCGYVGVPPDHRCHGVSYGVVEGSIDVHGCLTYADSCQDNLPKEEAICHIAGPGEPEHVWWFGFDCGHFRDLVPLFKYDLPALADFPPLVYRNLSYVKQQCASLAVQLQTLGV